MKVYLMIAEHHSIPGIVTRVCSTRGKAIFEALACVNMMLEGSDWPLATTAEGDMDMALEFLQDTHGAAHCYAEISEHDVI